ncbi:uncharacterized protein LOC127092544 [Lathyrus oleraceus]|uniref:Lysine ketoglutarate reductase trans-splicing-like protein n=1 Tax=Pisum sativum TaxID=3888 RepID=A0A9D4W4H7_PEA|nr:uncharacterized protein LOC127092544 [Pisum sativum]KAI5394788.1 hypothetical protein KIW84_061414 [Pisum sativum]
MPDMKASPSRTVLVAESKTKMPCFYAILPATFLLCVVLFFTTSIFSQSYKEKLSSFTINPNSGSSSSCKKKCRPSGSEALPEGIVASTSRLEMRPLWAPPHFKRGQPHYQEPQVKMNVSANLFAMAVGIKQKDLVDKMVKKFLASNFSVMLFHYDGVVDEWKKFEWHDRVIHISVVDQSKWWFAKRFLHPDIVADYDYIFLWDEDLGVENFHPKKYVSIVKEEGLEISQPALDPKQSEIHHQITAQGRRSKVHRRTFKAAGSDGKGCDESSTAPPCTGWIEMMAPVFSKAAWRCVWYMIQNDLIHAWGLDMQLGYCSQGDRTKNVGVVDAEYIVHYNRPTLGGIDKTTVSNSSQEKEKDHRVDVRRLSYQELDIFRKRWEKAVEEDKCWVDPFK